MYLMLVECLLININDRYLFKFFQAGFYNAYPGADRLYENIIMIIKPFGFYPGTTSASIAATISILYLSASKSISENKAFFIAAVLVFFVSFSLTAFLTLICVKMLLRFRFKLSLNSIAVTHIYLLFFT